LKTKKLQQQYNKVKNTSFPIDNATMDILTQQETIFRQVISDLQQLLHETEQKKRRLILSEQEEKEQGETSDSDRNSLKDEEGKEEAEAEGEHQGEGDDEEDVKFDKKSSSTTGQL
jgi:hypothetical protein